MRRAFSMQAEKSRPSIRTSRNMERPTGSESLGRSCSSPSFSGLCSWPSDEAGPHTSGLVLLPLFSHRLWVSGSHVFTNHFLNLLGDGTDPVKATTSVIVPTWFDRLHFNFSYHTEHHLFPNMNSEYYPALSRILAEHFGREYNRILIGSAWSQLWKLESFVQAPRNPRTRPAAILNGPRANAVNAVNTELRAYIFSCRKIRVLSSGEIP